MNFDQMIIDIEKGIKRSITSRRHNIIITPDDFNFLTENYLNQIKNIDFNELEVYPKEYIKLIFLIRCYYKLWVEQNQNTLKIYKNFPSRFKIIKDIVKQDYGYLPKPFYKDQILFYVDSTYSNCNRLRGVPLWDNLNPVEGTDSIPSVQINFNFITPIFD